jgi:hypothetical protein
MVYNTQDYIIFGLLTSSSFLKVPREYNVSETWSVPVFRWRVGNTYSIGSIRKN